MTAPAPGRLVLQVPHKLFRKLLALEQTPPLPEQSPQIVPRTLVLRRQSDLHFRVLHFSINQILVNNIADFIKAFPGFGINVAAKENKVAVVPGAVVADVGREEGLDVREFSGVPEGEVPDEPLPIRPDMVVLCIFGKHAGEEGEFRRWEGVEAGH